MSKICPKLDIFFKKIVLFFPKKIAKGKFLKQMTIFGNFLTFKWQFSGGSDLKI